MGIDNSQFMLPFTENDVTMDFGGQFNWVCSIPSLSCPVVYSLLLTEIQGGFETELAIPNFEQSRPYFH
jgi:hypothetical protein